MKPRALRLFLWFFKRVLYRVTALSPDNVPVRGGALLVSNHVSLVDMLLILASTRRFVRFLLPQRVCERRWLKPFLRYLRVIALPPESRANELTRALEQAHNAIQRGEVIGVFAEQSISRIGVMLSFRHEFEQIMEGLTAPIIPICLDGVWGSIFSYQQGRFFWKLPRRVPYPVTISFGKPMASTANAFEVRNAIQELNTDAWPRRRTTLKPLHRAFVQRARRCPLRLALADARTPQVSFGSALARTTFLARRLRSHWADQEMVGILLPPSVPGALVNFAALLMGKVPVNLNYTLSEETLAACARRCRLQTILTSQAFLDRVKAKIPCRTLLLEDIAARPRLSERLLALLLAWFAPVGVLEQVAGRQRRGTLDDLATVIFSSGSTGEPKGVMLTHYNVASNAEQLGQTFDFGPQDRFLGILPFFHSFGFTATLVTPALLGMGVALHPNPLDAKAIGEMVRRYGITHLMATPTFLQIYLRSCEPADFGSLRLVMVGAEKLPDRLATAFEEKFGIRPVEGYGCTECSPVVAGNTRDFRAAGVRQVGSRRGSIGRPLPGVSVRVVAPDTLTPLPLGQPGLLLVRGPNVMRGYLGQPEKTAEVFVSMAAGTPPAVAAGILPAVAAGTPPAVAAGILPGVAAGILPAVEQGVSPGGTGADSLEGAETSRLVPGGKMPSSTSSGTPAATTQRWYITGDIATLDEDGFLQITDRLSRFSKLGGEMVPHIRIEEKLHELAGVHELKFAVTGISDEKKGERLVVLHTLGKAALAEFLKRLPQADLPNLWIPKANQFFAVDGLPHLASGKIDLRKIRDLATRLSAEAEAGRKEASST